MRLPDKFTNYMTVLLKEDYEVFIKSFDDPRHYGLRLNSLKNTTETKEKITKDLAPIPWCKDGFYYLEEERPAKDPYYFAGAYYIQEPSAMTPATALRAQPGDKVIDLCAAPGGKTTQIASDLRGQGLLVSNDISHGRVKNLNKNIQLSGIRNALVLSEDPIKLAKRWPMYFDKVLIDAPCSGEGMFRKEAKLVSSWENDGPEGFIEVQRSLLTSAHELLRVGGELVYSTCTYNLEENESNIVWFLQTYEGYEVVDISTNLGVSSGFDISDDYDLSSTARVWPHRHKGEGHYIAKLRKITCNHSLTSSIKIEKATIGKAERDFFEDFLKDLGYVLTEEEYSRLNLINETLYMLPAIGLATKGLRVFSNGWLLGTFKKNRFEPSQAFASGMKVESVDHLIDYSHENSDVIRYLKGETLSVDAPNGWHLVAVDGLSLGFGKVVNKRLKNKYEATWRWQ